MSARWRKVAADLAEHPGRTVLVWLAVAVGTAAVATSFGARAVLTREIDASFRSTNPAAAILVLEGVDAGLVERARRRPGVTDADARRTVRARVEVAPGLWRPLWITAVRDFSDLRVATFNPSGGAWPPPDGELLVERSCLSVLGVATGGSLHVRAPGGATADLRVAGLVHDPGEAPGWQDHVGYAYATPATLERLGQPSSLDELLVAVAEPDRAAASRVADELTAWLAAEGRAVSRVSLPARRHPHADHMNATMVLIEAFSVFALVLAAALVASVVAATLARHTRQIGVMKTLGATAGQIAGIYFAFVAALAGSAALAGVALGTLGARAFAGFVVEQLNLYAASHAVPAGTLALEVALGAGMPLVASAVPVLRAARMPAHEAIRDPGVRAPSRAAGRGRFLARLTRDTALVLALRNTFRRPARLALTLGALALGGAMLMASVNVYFGLLGAVDASLEARGDDVEARLLRAAPAEELLAVAAAVPGVWAAEAWGVAHVGVEAGEPDGAPPPRYALFARPEATVFSKLSIVEGRWPVAGEADAVVASRALAAREPGVRVGAEVVLVHEGRRTTARVVGMIEEVAPPALYADPSTYEAVTAAPGRAGTLLVATDLGEASRVATALEEALVDAGHFPGSVMTKAELREAVTDHLLILLAVLAGAAVASVVVGGLGLATSMSLNVLERSREMGVARAIGATPRAVVRMLLVEAAAVLAASFALSIALSAPATAIVNRMVAGHGLFVTVPVVLSPWAIGGWAILATAITLVACLGPARTSLRMSVREVLAYE